MPCCVSESIAFQLSLTHILRTHTEHIQSLFQSELRRATIPVPNRVLRVSSEDLSQASHAHSSGDILIFEVLLKFPLAVSQASLASVPNSATFFPCEAHTLTFFTEAAQALSGTSFLHYFFTAMTKCLVKVTPRRVSFGLLVDSAVCHCGDLSRSYCAHMGKYT